MSHLVTVRCVIGIVLVQVQLLVELVAPDPLQVVVALVEELLFQEFAGIIQRGRVARAHALEELEQRRFGDRLMPLR